MYEARLSGVSMCGPFTGRAHRLAAVRGGFTGVQVPLDPDEAILGSSYDLPVDYPVINESNLGRHMSIQTMHERCWSLLKRVLDENVIKAHLFEFASAAWEVANTVENKKNRTIHNLPGPIEEADEWKELWERYNDKLGKYPEKCWRKFEKYLQKRDKVYAYRDPVNIPEVREFFQETSLKSASLDGDATKRGGAEDSKKWKSSKSESFQSKSKQPKTRTNYRTPDIHRQENSASSSVAKSETRTIHLPAEVILLIIDYLPDVEDLKNLLCAFPRWRFMIPDSYWRSQILSQRILFEQEVPDINTQGLDWACAYFGLNDFNKRSHGLRSRQWIVNHLMKINEVFLQILHSREI